MGWRKQSISISGVRSEIKQLTVALQLKYSEYLSSHTVFRLLWAKIELQIRLEPQDGRIKMT